MDKLLYQHYCSSILIFKKDYSKEGNLRECHPHMKRPMREGAYDAYQKDLSYQEMIEGRMKFLQCSNTYANYQKQIHLSLYLPPSQLLPITKELLHRREQQCGTTQTKNTIQRNAIITLFY